MPNLKNFQYNKLRHFRSMDKNLCANLIRHEHIITGRTKAKRAQAKIERFLGRAFYENSRVADQLLESRLANVRAMNFLQPPDRKEIGTKVLEDLSQRYVNRTHGFTRIIKLERRLGTDKAEMSLLELVDSDLEIKFWYVAKIVARLELQGLPVDELTQHNVKKLVQLRVNGEKRFRAAVEEAKNVFFKDDVNQFKQLAESGESVTIDDIEESVDPNTIDDDWPLHLKERKKYGTYLQNKPNKTYLEKVKLFGTSKKYGVVPRPEKEKFIPPKSPFLK